ncbi:MAG: SDR family oxidoreductase [Chloroflexi bacterium]|nr:SDR family oxidoreductase [Chloroflexota bacterium]
MGGDNFGKGDRHLMGSLEGRVALVTGGGQGLGRAYALRLARDGARTVIVDVQPQAASSVCTEIELGGGTALPVTAEVSRETEVAAAVDATVRRFGQIDVLVNNAGGAFYPTAPFDTIAEAQWTHVLSVNLTGQWLCAKHVAPHMKRRQSGRIINITSAVVHRGYPPGLTPYIAAKAGVIGLTRALAHELGAFDITVNAVAPGYTPVPTPKQVHLGNAAERLRQQMVDEQCLKRSETPDDLADVIAFLASDSARFITGQVINVDGGWTMA